MPGEYVEISGQGFLPGETVRLHVTHVDGPTEPGHGHEPWYVSADENGSISSLWYVHPDDSAHATFLLTAYGMTSELYAETTFTDRPGATLQQCRNGPSSTPNDCAELGGSAGWVTGNTGASHAHLVEGYSIPYRTIMTELPVGVPVTIDIGYDIRHSGKHAVDFLTHYQRYEPHLGFGHPAETVFPLSGVSGVSATVTQVDIPAPSSVGSPVAGQPTIRFNSLPAAERKMTLFGGTLTGMSYVSQGSLIANNSETVVRIQFTPDSATAVLAWGGHIARTADWGPGQAATGINGSPYHMRLKDWFCDDPATPATNDCGNLGNQDRSTAAATVFPTGTLRIVKNTTGDADGVETFNFSTTGVGLDPNFSITTAGSTGSRVYTDILAGTKTITENTGGPPFNAGWEFVSLQCTGDPDVVISGATATVDLSSGENVVCTYTNNLVPPRLKLVKTVTNDNGGTRTPNEWDLSATGSSGSFTELTPDAATATFRDVTPGVVYTLSEVGPAGYQMGSFVCAGGGTQVGNTIQLNNGESATCTVNNNDISPTLRVNKILIPSSDTGLFNLQIDGSTAGTGGNVGNGGTTGAVNVNAGAHTVGETAGTGTSLSNYISVIGGDCAPDGSVSLALGENKVCTITNTRRGNLTIVKDAVPNDPQDFSFTTTGGLSPSSFSLDDDADATLSNTRTFGNIAPGTYSVSEGLVAGWDLTSATCSDGSPVSNIEVSPGESVTCTFVNTKRGSLTIIKDAIPDDPQDFFFSTTGGLSPSTFSLDDDADATLSNTRTFSNIIPGTYSVSEGGVAGWDLTSATCSDGSPVSNIQVSPGESVTCTFVNTKRGSLTIVKDAIPNDPQDFSFTTTGGLVPASFSLDDDADPTLSNTRTYGSVIPGTYSVSEGAVAGWDLTSATCDDGSPVSNIQVSPGESVTCTFVNTKRGNLTIIKDAVPNDPQDFSFTTTGGLSPSSFSLDDDADATLSNTRTYSNIVPGTYSVSEGAVAGWDLTSATCSDGSPVSNIEVSPGESVTCTFVNTKRGRIIVEKQTNPDGAAGSFTFTGDAAGSISDNGQLIVDNLVPGTYTSTESDPTPEFDLTSIVCNDGGSATPSSGDTGTRTATFRVDPGETVTCVFTNTKRGMARVIKTFRGGPPTQSAGQGFVFQIRQGATVNTVGVILESHEANVDNGGDLMFATKLLPNTVYQLCEIVMPGWSTTLGTHGQLFVPEGNLPDPDNSVMCFNFSLSPGELRTFNVDNTPPPQGLTRTIGFWKNWSSCDGNGRQRPVLDDTLAMFPLPPSPLPNPIPATIPTTPGFYVGDLYLDTCEEAIRLLAKRPLPDGKPMASHPAFNFAAQYIAAKLNIQAGAVSPACAVSAIAAGQTILDNLNFNGTTSMGNISRSVRNQLLSLATTLDTYNNTGTCGP